MASSKETMPAAAIIEWPEVRQWTGEVPAWISPGGRASLSPSVWSTGRPMGKPIWCRPDTSPT